MTIQTSFKAPEASLWKELNWNPSSKQIEQFITFQKLLSQFNSEVNLTRLVHGEDYWIGQIFDSLWPFLKERNFQQRELSCIDVGTGCGFPGFAIAIAFTKAEVTLVDSSRKKTRLLKKISTEIGLSSRIKILTERIELTGQNKAYRNMFDLAMARAVANAPVVAEYLIPLIKQSGEAFLFRGKWSKIDSQNLTKALISLNASIEKVDNIELPSKRGKRHMIRIKAQAPCPPIYPRTVGIPTKRPLGL